jgi:uncharacterized membrane protein YedE/YeeE
MIEPNLVGGLAGGALIGLAAVLLLLVNGRIAGVSGIIGSLLTGSVAGDRLWRIAFVLGLAAGAGLYALATGSLVVELQAQGLTVMVAGFLVGVGTQLGSGCTSGHGVCGIARLSKRSIWASATFIGVGVLTVYVMRHLLT